MIHWPFLRTNLRKTRVACDTYGTLSEVHTFGEIFQLLGLLQHTIDVPEFLRPLARVPRDIYVRAPVTDFRATDVALVSPSSPIELTFRGVSMNRHTLLWKVSAEISKDDPSGPKLLQQWLKMGLERMNEPVRAEAAAKLLPIITGNTEAAELVRAAVQETRSRRGDLKADLYRLRGILERPIGLVLYYFHYMRDGRALCWPAGFHEELVSAARELEIPVHDPAPLVLQYGLAAALKGNRHYSPAFLPLAGEALANFIASVFEKGTLGPAGTA